MADAAVSKTAVLTGREGSTPSLGTHERDGLLPSRFRCGIISFRP